MKKRITIRLDEDILEWFKSRGGNYQTLINDVLRGAMSEKKIGGKERLSDIKRTKSAPDKIIKTVDDIPLTFRPYTKDYQARKRGGK